MKNIYKELKTTITGLLVWIITGLYFALPYYSDRATWTSEHWETTTGFFIGLGLILAPDELIKILVSIFKRKSK